MNDELQYLYNIANNLKSEKLIKSYRNFSKNYLNKCPPYLSVLKYLNRYPPVNWGFYSSYKPNGLTTLVGVERCCSNTFDHARWRGAVLFQHLGIQPRVNSGFSVRQLIKNQV